MLQQVLANSTAEALALSNGCTIAAYPARPAAVRGLRARVVVLDELAFYRSSDNLPDRCRDAAGRAAMSGDDGRQVVHPVLALRAERRAVRPAPSHFGRDDSPVLVWQASAPEMNPTLSPDYLQRMAQDDPEAYRSEVLGEFRAGVSTFLDSDSIAASVEAGVSERSRASISRMSASTIQHRALGPMPWTKAIAHREGDRVVLDVLRSWLPPIQSVRRHCRVVGAVEGVQACSRRPATAMRRVSYWRASAHTASPIRRAFRTAVRCIWSCCH